MLFGAAVAGLDQVPRDVDAHHVCAGFCLGHRRGAIAAPEIQYLESFLYSESLHERLAALAHRVGNAREIAFFPERFVRISRSIHNVSLSLALLSRNAMRSGVSRRGPI